jgi:hypothetical protein
VLLAVAWSARGTAPAVTRFFAPLVEPTGQPSQRLPTVGGSSIVADTRDVERRHAVGGRPGARGVVGHVVGGCPRRGPEAVVVASAHLAGRQTPYSRWTDGV